MRNEIAVTVRAPGTAPRTYVFDEHPVEIGRSPDCHVAICHEAIPRRLCAAWLEDGGAGVRVEERPGLTNPLMRGAHPVSGGIGGDRLDLSVGPVEITVAPAGEGVRVRPGRPSVARRIGMAVAATVALAAALAALMRPGENDSTTGPPIPELPESAFEPPIAVPASRADADRAGLLYTRARSILEAGDPGPRARAEAAVLLRRSARIAAASGDTSAARIDAEWRSLTESIEQRYRREVIDLRRHLALGDAESSRRSGAIVAAILEGAGRQVPEDLAVLLREERGGRP